MIHLPRVLLSSAALFVLSPTLVWGSCAENLTRIQAALPRAAPDVQSLALPLVTAAQERLKARDAAGCEAAALQVLQLLQLPMLPPIQLSTPWAGPQELAHSNKPSEPAASAQRASTALNSGASASTNAAPPPSAGPVSPASTSPGAVGPSQRGSDSGQAASQGSEPARPAGTGHASEAQSQVPATPRSPPAGQAQAHAQSQAESASQVSQSAIAGVLAMPFFVSSRELIGSEVIDPDNTGRTLGRVSNIIIDKVTGQTAYVTLDSAGFLGWNRNRVIIPYSILTFSGQWDRPSLRVPASKVENAPQIRDQDLDALLRDPDWRRAVRQYFGTELAENSPSAGGPAGLQASAGPSGPRRPEQSTPDLSSSPTVPSSDPKAAPGEGATSHTAAKGDPAAAQTTALSLGRAGGGPDLAHGKAAAQRACAACHTFEHGGASRVGPNLFGITTRPIAGVSGYRYSTALKGHQGNWDQRNLDAFLKSPRAYAPGTSMTFPGIRSDQDRQNVVAYLETLK